MALRIEECVIDGILDNREKGRVTGLIHIAGFDHPFMLDLKGDFLRDIAGCVVEFYNPAPLPSDVSDLAMEQAGIVGEMTASRKVKIPDVSYEKIRDLKQSGRDYPWHWDNSIYLEWFSDANGRIVIESTDYHVTVSEPAWIMSDEEERTQKNGNATAFSSFMKSLTEAIEVGRDDTNDLPEDMNEFQWEKLMRHSDNVTSKYSELLDKYIDDPDCDKIIAEQMGWTKQAAQGDKLHDFDVFDHELEEELDTPNFEIVLNSATEGIDWVEDESGAINHPLAIRCRDLGLEIIGEMTTGKEIIDSENSAGDFAGEIMITSGKVAGAMHDVTRGHEPDKGFIVACLKRAHSHLQVALNLLPILAEKEMLIDQLNQYRNELFGIREDLLNLIKRYR